MLMDVHGANTIKKDLALKWKWLRGFHQINSHVTNLTTLADKTLTYQNVMPKMSVHGAKIINKVIVLVKNNQKFFHQILLVKNLKKMNLLIKIFPQALNLNRFKQLTKKSK